MHEATTEARVAMPHIERKREGKRQQIIESAERVILRDGLRACTARAISDEGPLTKSAINYYFDSIEDVIDAAMNAHLEQFFQRLRDAAAEHEDPHDRFWAVIEAYLATFAEVPGATTVWFAYWLDNMERGRIELNRTIQHRIAEVLAELLAHAGVDDPPARARALFSYLIGATLRQKTEPVPFDQLRPEITALSLARDDTPHAPASDPGELAESASAEPTRPSSVRPRRAPRPHLG